MKSFQSMVEETRILVQAEIKNKENRPSYMLDKQLYTILEELDKMENIRNIQSFLPYYPKGITDCWDDSHPLAIKLMDLLEIYRKL